MDPLCGLACSRSMTESEGWRTSRIDLTGREASGEGSPAPKRPIDAAVAMPCPQKRLSPAEARLEM